MNIGVEISRVPYIIPGNFGNILTPDKGKGREGKEMKGNERNVPFLNSHMALFVA